MPISGEEGAVIHLQRLVVDMYDHDCEDGHGPDCVPFETRSAWLKNGDVVTDPEEIARLEIRLREAEADNGAGD